MSKKHKPDEQDAPVPREPLVPDPVLYFALPGILPASYRFAYHERLRTLNLLAVSEQGPQLLRDQQFTEQEVAMLVPLLRAYPTFCPYEVLHAHLTSQVVTAKEVTKSQQRLASSRRMGVGEQELRRVRNIISRTRLKLLVFNIDIVTIQAVGCLLLLAHRAPNPTG